MKVPGWGGEGGLQGTSARQLHVLAGARGESCCRCRCCGLADTDSKKQAKVQLPTKSSTVLFKVGVTQGSGLLAGCIEVNC
jgi:hypothetical protein